MFTGIVEELGEIVAFDALGGDAARVTVSAPTVASDASHGDSIAVNGVCLTVIETDGLHFTADVMAETLHRSDLGALHIGSPVNLERPVTMSSRLGGHIVQGHVDGVGVLMGRETQAHWEVVSIGIDANLTRYVVEKGSITVDGISLTVASIDGAVFTVSLIPTTLALTTLGRKDVGDRVNIEVDMMAKYVEKLLEWRGETQ